MPIDPNIILVIAGGFAFLYIRHRLRSSRRQLLARHRGLHYELRGLEDLPVQLQQTVLFAAADGGHELDVLSGNPVIADESIPLHIFSFRFQRDVRGESVVVTAEPPFFLTSPTTVITYTLPRDLGHLLVKRAGPADQVGELIESLPTSGMAVARQGSGIDRMIAVPPPPPLPAEPLDLPQLAPDYRAWAARPDEARSILGRETADYLQSPAAGRHEWVIELLGPLMLVYCASFGALSEEETLAMNEFTDELCRRVLRSTTTLSPRGVELRP